ncbi:hypothetical protein V1512DRAFT_256091 [Lipomyces arxii]|uniref:uncharacterized protein n=1 Tax=Lipomyces arxii TaxID=56418 RepID=UPI0034CDF15D
MRRSFQTLVSAFRFGIGRRVFVRGYAIKALECCACGSKLHYTADKDLPGYVSKYIMKRVTDGIDFYKENKVVKESDVKFEDLASKLSVEDRALINLDSVETESEPTSAQLASIKRSPEEIMRRVRAGEVLCKRCHGMYNHNNASLLPRIKFQELFAALPDHPVTIVLVMDVYDFPLSFIPIRSLLRMYGKQADRVIYVVNRIDLVARLGVSFENVFRHPLVNTLHGLLKIEDKNLPQSRTVTETDSVWDLAKGSIKTRIAVEHAMAHLEQVGHKIPHADFHVVSGQRGWGIKKLFNALPAKSYFIGHTNAGKSRLIQELMHHQRMNPPRHVLNNRKTFQETGPGASFMPGMTREAMSYSVVAFNQIKRVTELPGLEDRGNDFWSHIKPELIKPLVKGRILKARNRDSKSVKAGQCLNIGGLVFLESTDLPFVVWNTIGQTGAVWMYVNTDLEKAMETLQNPEKSRPMCLDTSKPYKFGPAQEFTVGGGGLEIVIQGLGSVEVRMTGRIPPKGAKVKVHTLEKMVVGARVPFVNLLDSKLRIKFIEKGSGSDSESKRKRQRKLRRKGEYHDRYPSDVPT